MSDDPIARLLGSMHGLQNHSSNPQTTYGQISPSEESMSHHSQRTTASHPMPYPGAGMQHPAGHSPASGHFNSHPGGVPSQADVEHMLKLQLGMMNAGMGVHPNSNMPNIQQLPGRSSAPGHVPNVAAAHPRHSTAQSKPTAMAVSAPSLFASGTDDGFERDESGTYVQVVGGYSIPTSKSSSFSLANPGEETNNADRGLPQLPSTTIARLSSEPKAPGSSAVAVNRMFMCYVLKGGWIRVISIRTGDRLRFQGDASGVSDIRFVGNQTDILSSVGDTGMIRIWRIKQSSDGTQKPGSSNASDLAYEVTNELVAEIGDESNIAPNRRPRRLVWLPVDSAGRSGLEFASLSPAGGAIWYAASGGSGALTRFDLLTEAPATDACYSPDGCLFALSDLSGVVQVWQRIDGSTSAWTLMKSWRPTPTITKSLDDAVGCVRFVGCRLTSAADFLGTGYDPAHPLLVTGNATNDELQLWSLSQPMTKSPELCQTISMKISSDTQDSNDSTKVGLVDFDPTGRFLIVASSTTQRIMILHFNMLNRAFDYIKVFELSEAILSWSVQLGVGVPVLPLPNAPPQSLSGLTLYCVHKDVVQLLETKISECYTPHQLSQTSVTGASLAPIAANPVVPSTAKVTPPRSSPPTPPIEKDNIPVIPAAASPTAMTSIPRSQSHEGGTSSSHVLAGVERLLKRERELIFQRFDQERAVRETAVSASEARILDAVSQSVYAMIQQHLGHVLEKELKASVQAHVLPALTKVINVAVDNKMKDLLKAQSAHSDTALSKMESSVIRAVTDPEVSKALAASASSTLREAVESSFLETLLPAMERGVEEMFSQIDKSIILGLDMRLGTPVTEILTQQKKEISVTLATLTKATKDMEDAVQKLSRNEIDTSVSNIPSRLASPPIAASNIKVEIDSLLKSHRINDALTKALSASDLDVVMWTLEKVGDRHKVFSAVPMPLTQPVLLSLIQQLAFDLSNSSACVKLEWLRDALMVLNPRDSQISAHVRFILDGVAGNLASNQAKFSGNGVIEEVYKMDVYIVNSLLASFG